MQHIYKIFLNTAVRKISFVCTEKILSTDKNLAE